MKISALVKMPGQPAQRQLIDNDLETLQILVGGYIEAVNIDSDLVVVCNEEGMINDLPFNTKLCGHYFFGTIALVGIKDDEFADCPQIEGFLPMDFRVMEKR